MPNFLQEWCPVFPGVVLCRCWETFTEQMTLLTIGTWNSTKAGFTKSKLDSCLYFCHGESADLQGVLGTHVDDTITGGCAPKYQRARDFLKSRFPFKKLREGQGEFLGTVYTQHPNGEITFQQKEYDTQHIRPISISEERVKQPWLPATEKEISAL